MLDDIKIMWHLPLKKCFKKSEPSKFKKFGLFYRKIQQVQHDGPMGNFSSNFDFQIVVNFKFLKLLWDG